MIDLEARSGAPDGDAPSEARRERRFGGLGRLYGVDALARLGAAHACVVGVGGVGSWAVEALARSGVGKLTLIDLDHIAESNINRQIHALESTLGASKVAVMRDRIAQISPDCKVQAIDDFLTVENIGALVPGEAWLIDAIDQPRVKAALIAWARERGQRLITCGAAGARVDPLALKRVDLAQTRGDALLSSVRARLRREHGFSRKLGEPFGVPAITSEELPLASAAEPACEPGAPLACSGYGSSVALTATMGFAAAAWVIDAIARPTNSRSRPR